MQRSIAVVALLAFVACKESTPRPAKESAPLARVAVEVEGDPAADLVVPAGDGPWSLASLLDESLPEMTSWRELVVTNAGGQTLRVADPAALPSGEELRFTLHDGKVALGLFLVPGDDASAAVVQAARTPSRLLLAPSRLAIRTRSRPEPDAKPWPELAVEVDGKDRARLERGRLADAELVAQPGRPQRKESFILATVAASYVPRESIGRIELENRDGERLVFDAEALASDLLLLRPTRKGVWTLKEFVGDDKRRMLRDIVSLRITTKARADERRGPPK